MIINVAAITPRPLLTPEKPGRPGRPDRPEKPGRPGNPVKDKPTAKDMACSPVPAECLDPTGMSPVKGIIKVYICSPFRPVGETEEEHAWSRRNNRNLVRWACRYAVEKGYSPICPHLYYPEFLDDTVGSEREIGMLLGVDGLRECRELWIIGRQITEGMRKEINQAKQWGIPVKRYVPRYTPEEQILKRILGDDFPYSEMI